MTSTALKLLAGLLVLTAPAALGVAAQTDHVNVPGLSSSTAEAEDREAVETVEGTFDEAPATGALDLRVDRGAVHVEAWDEPAYEVKVVQTPTDDDRTEVTVDDASGADEINVSVTVDRRERTGADVETPAGNAGDGSVERAIVAKVPASTSFELVHACEGERGAVHDTVDDTLDQLPGSEDDDTREACVVSDDPEGFDVTIDADPEENERELNVTWGAHGLTGETLELSADHGDAFLSNLTFAQVHVATEHGDLKAIDLDTDTLKAATDHGDLALVGDLGEVEATAEHGALRVSGTADTASVDAEHGDVRVNGDVGDGSIHAEHGDVSLRLEPTTDGAFNVTAEHGDVTAAVPEEPTYGYDVLASTEHGDVNVTLDDTETQASSQDGEESDEERVHVRTENYAEREIQLDLVLENEHGDVVVGDLNEAGEASEGDDEAGGSSSTSAEGGVLDRASALR